MSKEKTPHVHASLIHAWANGATIQWKSGEKWADIVNPEWNPCSEYRIKPSAPETRMAEPELRRIYDAHSGDPIYAMVKAVANAAIARALADGDVVLP